MTKFVVVAHYSSLPEYLRLDLHPGIVLLGQLFNRSDYALMERLDECGGLIKVGEDPIEFLGRLIDAQDASAVGFIMLYDHAQGESWSKVWRHVRKEYKVIHLKRRNLLNAWLSLTETPAKVVPSQLQRDIGILQAGRRDNDIIFRHTETLDLYFEDLLGNPVDTFNEVYEFLGVAPLDGEILVDIDFVEPIHAEVLLNYEELRAHFSGQPIGEYFNQ